MSVFLGNCWEGALVSFPPPLSLSGHEFPFSIQMSHVMQTLSQGGEGRDAAASPADRQVALQMEQLQAYKQCQFILKPRPTDTQPPAPPPPTGRSALRRFDSKKAAVVTRQ